MLDTGMTCWSTTVLLEWQTPEVSWPLLQPAEFQAALLSAMLSVGERRETTSAGASLHLLCAQHVSDLWLRTQLHRLPSLHALRPWPLIVEQSKFLWRETWQHHRFFGQVLPL